MATMVTIRHQQLPEITADSELFFEVLIFLQSLIVLGCQYLNLYKTAWWMPYSTALYAIVSLSYGFNTSHKYLLLLMHTKIN